MECGGKREEGQRDMYSSSSSAWQVFAWSVCTGAWWRSNWTALCMVPVMVCLLTGLVLIMAGETGVGLVMMAVAVLAVVCFLVVLMRDDIVETHRYHRLREGEHPMQMLFATPEEYTSATARREE